MYKGSRTMPLGGFDDPTLYDIGNIKFDALDDCIKQDLLVLTLCGQMKVRFKLGIEKLYQTFATSFKVFI